MMGSLANEEGRSDSEGPLRQVTIAKPFAVGKFEVTFADWDACVSAGGCKQRPGDEGWGRGRRPVINVSWSDVAQQYLAWLSLKTGKTYRLLSEAEWEYAARAGTTTPFSTGSTITSDQANFDGIFAYGRGPKGGVARRKTVNMGLFRPNAFGLYDVHGNVWEWVQDCFEDTYAPWPLDGSAVPDVEGCNRVARGGAWSNMPQLLRSAKRDSHPPGTRLNNVGFRLARSLEP
jgi:formylglycine-generating enzyme required for sulfatase activity